MYKRILIAFFALLLVNKLPIILDLVHNNHLGIRLSQTISDYSTLDFWYAFEKWSIPNAKSKLTRLQMFCVSIDQSPTTSYLLGICGWVVGDLEMAHRALNQAQNSRYELASLFDGRVYDYEGDKSLAASSWSSKGVHFYLLNTAYRWRLKGHFKRAVELYEVIYTGQTEVLDAKLVLMSAYLDAHYYKEAKEMADLIILQDPRNIPAQLALVHILAFGEKQYEAALQLGSRLLAEPNLSDERRASLYQKLGRIERQLGNTQASIEYFTQYRDLSITPDWYGHYFIAQTYRMANRLDKALNYINLALSMTPNRSLCLMERGFIYLQLGDIKLALQDFDLAIQLDPNNIGRHKLILDELRRTEQMTVVCELLKDKFESDSQGVARILQNCP